MDRRPIVGERVRIRTDPSDPSHRRVRYVMDDAPYYVVEDRWGNTGMYKADQMEPFDSQ